MPERFLKHFSRREKQTTFVVIGALRFNLLALEGIVGLAVEVITVSVCDVIVAVIKVINVYSINLGIVWTRADPEGGGAVGPDPPPEKSQKI